MTVLRTIAVVAFTYSVLVTTVSGTTVTGTPLLSAPGPSIFANAPFVLGFQFAVGTQDIEVVALGYQDRSAGLTGLADAHDVGLWTVDGTLLATATVQAGAASALVDEYRYEDLVESVVLSANMSYIIVGVTTIADSAFTFGNVATDQGLVPSGFTVEGPRWTAGSDIGVFPATTTSTPSGSFWTSANLLINPVPLPAGFPLLLSALAALGVTLRRKAGATN